jgi:hypothetical protein
LYIKIVNLIENSEIKLFLNRMNFIVLFIWGNCFQKKTLNQLKKLQSKFIICKYIYKNILKTIKRKS